MGLRQFTAQHGINWKTDLAEKRATAHVDLTMETGREGGKSLLTAEGSRLMALDMRL